MVLRIGLFFVGSLLFAQITPDELVRGARGRLRPEIWSTERKPVSYCVSVSPETRELKVRRCPKKNQIRLVAPIKAPARKPVLIG